MKDRVGAILRPGQERYLDRLLPPRDPLLAEMERFAAEHDVPISDPEVGRLLELLAAAVARGPSAQRPGGPPPGSWRWEPPSATAPSSSPGARRRPGW